MESKQVVFFPKTLLGMSDITVELLGFIKLIKNVRYYFVLPNYIKNTSTGCKVKTIGHFTRTDCRACFKRRVTNILCITEINGNLNASLLPGQLDNFVLVIYDPSRLYDYGTIFNYEGDSQKFICFIMLSNWLSSTENVQKQYHLSNVVMFQRFTKYLLIILNVLINSLESKIVQFTILRLTLFKHILGVMKNYVWLQVIKVLQGTLQWLMGSPAGLKLNDPLNSLLGTCFLYLVNLWWSFLDANNNGNGKRDIDTAEVCAASSSCVHNVDMVC
ncbi:hypothetical protein ACI65C_004768 [Semiaphis heraclei]